MKIDCLRVMHWAQRGTRVKGFIQTVALVWMTGREDNSDWMHLHHARQLTSRSWSLCHKSDVVHSMCQVVVGKFYCFYILVCLFVVHHNWAIGLTWTNMGISAVYWHERFIACLSYTALTWASSATVHSDSHTLSHSCIGYLLSLTPGWCSIFLVQNVLWTNEIVGSLISTYHSKILPQ